MIDDKEKYDRQVLVSYLESRGARMRGRSVFCPYHENKHTPSAWVSKSPSGVWRFTCGNAACGVSGDIFDLRSRDSGKSRNELIVRKLEDATKPARKLYPPQWPALQTLKESQPIAWEDVARLYPQGVAFPYRSEGTNEVVAVVIRQDFVRVDPDTGERTKAKEITQWSWDENRCCFVNKQWSDNRPLFRVLPPKQDKPVLVVEGEKCVCYLAEADVCAVTPLGGSSAQPKVSDWSFLKNRDVVIWPDNDEPGKKFATNVAAHLKEIAKSVAVLDLGRIPVGHGEDAADIVQSLADKHGIDAVSDKIWEVINTGMPGNDAPQSINSYFENLISGAYRPIPSPFAEFAADTCYNMVPNVVTLCGAPGAGKTFLVIQLCLNLMGTNTPFAMLAMEMEYANFMTRLLAQKYRRPELNNPHWQTDHPAEMQQIFESNKEYVLKFLRQVTVRKERQVMEFRTVVEWAESKLRSGARQIIIDPVTAISARGEQKHIMDQDFVLQCESLSRQYKANILLVTHPNDNSIKVRRDMSHVAGGKAYQQFSGHILILENHDIDKPVVLMGGAAVRCNKMLVAAKHRSGSVAQYSEYAMMLDSSDLMFKELGRVNKNAKASVDVKSAAKGESLAPRAKKDKDENDGPDLARRLRKVASEKDIELSFNAAPAPKKSEDDDLPF